MRNASTPAPLAARTAISRVALGLWFLAMLWVGAGMLARHSVALPGPMASSIERSVSMLRPHGRSGSWLALHVLASGCRCSERIVERLLSVPRPDGWSEVVLWVGEVAPVPELARRFVVRRVAAAELATYGVEGTPTLVAIDPDDHVRYAGGYADRKQSADDHTGRILRSVRAGKTVESLPLFGCATSARLKQALAVLPAP